MEKEGGSADQGARFRAKKPKAEMVIERQEGSNIPTGSSRGAAGGAISIGQCASIACLLEVTAPKPGNVHRGADFEDVGYFDFAASAMAIGPAMEAAPRSALGQTVLAAIQATRSVVATNTNLGAVLLIAPLASVPDGESLRSGTKAVLYSLRPEDAADVYSAIRLARPGGLGQVAESDIEAAPPSDLIQAMKLAEDRDLVARQYARDFEDVFDSAAPFIKAAIEAGYTLPKSITWAFLRLLAKFPDSLIARKLGAPMAQRISDRAGEILSRRGPEFPPLHDELADLDFFLRLDGHRRNPGTTADMIAAGLFVGLREGWLAPPFRM